MQALMVTVPAGVLPGQQFRVRARSTAFELAAATWGSFTVSHSFTAHRMPTLEADHTPPFTTLRPPPTHFSPKHAHNSPPHIRSSPAPRR